MVEIQLLSPQKGVLIPKEGTIFPINLSVAEIRDIQKRTGKFSKTVIVQGTTSNNRLLNFYFSVNTVAGTFDVNKLQRCVVLQNGLPILRNAYIQLLSINNVSQTQVNSDQLVEYELAIIDATANLYREIGNKLLTDISLDDLNHNYNANTVQGSFTNSYGDGYKYVLPYTTNNYYNLEECKPAVYVRTYLDRIFSRAGITYSIDDRVEDIVNKLVIPYNGDKPIIRQEEIEYNKVKSSLSSGSKTFNQPSGYHTADDAQVIISTEEQDNGGHYNHTTGVYTSPYYTGNLGAINVKVRFDYEFVLINTTINTAYLRGSGGTNPAGFRFMPYFKIFNNNGNDPLIYFLDNPNNYLIKTTSSTTYTINSGNNTIFTGTVEKTIALSGVFAVNNLDELTTYIGFDVHQAYPDQAMWRSSNSDSASTVQVNVKININNVIMEIVPSFNNVGYNNTIYMNDYIPKDIKQSDFLKSLTTMFNLYIEPDEHDDRKVYLVNRDTYYDNGAIKNWTKKVDREKGEVIKFLPELYQKEVLFTYKKDSDVVNKGYIDNTGEVYGQSLWAFDNEYIKGREIREIIFSPTPCAMTPFGALTPLINGVSPKTNIRILYDGGYVSTVNSYSIYNYGTNGLTGMTSYPLITHFDKADNPTFDLNFGVCDYYFYQLTNKTNNNLLNLYCRRTLSQINSGIMITVYVDLNEVDISTMKLSDKILIENKYYTINRIIDYDANSKNLTKVELLSADDNINLKKFPVSIFTRPIPSETAVSQPLGDLINEVISSQNTYSNPTQKVLSGTQNNIVDGNGVVISGYKNGAIGDDISIKGDNNFVTGNNVTLLNSSGNKLSNCYGVTLINTNGKTIEGLTDTTIVNGAINNGKESVRVIKKGENFTNLTAYNFVNSSLGDVTIYFETPDNYISTPFFFKKISSDSNSLVLDFFTNGNSTLDGSNNYIITTKYSYVYIIPVFNKWFIISKS